MAKAIFIVIDESRPPNVSFIEIEKEGGESIKIGERIKLPDMLTAIKITSSDIEKVYNQPLDLDSETGKVNQNEKISLR